MSVNFTNDSNSKIKLTLPCVDDRDAVIDDDIAIGLVSSGKGEEILANGGSAVLESDGEVDEVEVKVLQTELLQAVIESGLNLLGVVLDLSKRLLQGLGDLRLVAVDLSQVQVSVADLEGLVDTLADLTGRGLPCAVSQETGEQISSFLPASFAGFTYGILAPVLRVKVFP
ncbi:hypothetical protein HG530_015216 [Fusarium avenaceum]|nr:hypothetical protein HG530_015216 [Fusarium avenaceum]